MISILDNLSELCVLQHSWDCAHHRLKINAQSALRCHGVLDLSGADGMLLVVVAVAAYESGDVRATSLPLAQSLLL